MISADALTESEFWAFTGIGLVTTVVCVVAVLSISHYLERRRRRDD